MECECENNNNNKKKHRLCEKYYIWNLAACSCKNGKYVASTLDDSVIMCDRGNKNSMYWWCLWTLAILLFQTLMFLIIVGLSADLAKEKL